MADINELLRNTVTASVDGGHASEQWIKGTRKKPRSQREANPPETDDSAVKRGRREAAHGLDFEQLQEEIKRGQQAATDQLQQSSSTAALLSAQEAARMAHNVVEYVLCKELGGRHNSARGGEPPYVPLKPQVLAESATMRRAAGYIIHHVLYPSTLPRTGNEGEGEQTVMRSRVHQTRAPDGVVEVRRRLRVCATEQDLVGGVTRGLGAHTRQYLLRLVWAGLRGEAWTRDVTAYPAEGKELGTHSTSKAPTAASSEAHPPPHLDLFASPLPPHAGRASGSSGTPAGQPSSTVAQPEEGGFSLDAFLNSASSAEEEEDEAPVSGGPQ